MNKDDSDRKLREILENRVRFETLITDISARFVRIPSGEVDHEIERALSSILDYFEGDRCGILSVNQGMKFANITHASYREGVEQVSREVNMVEMFPWSYRRLTGGEVVCVNRLSEVPAEAKIDRTSWSAMGAKSTLSIPLFSARECRYLFAIHTTQKEYDWPEDYIPRLKLLGEIFVNALERRNADYALIESQARLDLAAHSAGAGMWTLDIAKGVFWITEKTRELFGFPPDREMTVDDFLELVHPEDRERIRQIILDGSQSIKEISEQYRILRPGGVLRWIASRGRSYPGSSGKLNHLMGVSVDITQRVQDEQKLLESRETLRAFTSRLLTIQEEERRRLARELHDDFTQRLAVLAMDVSGVEAAAKSQGAVYEAKLGQIRERLIRLSTDIHDISRQLHPSIIDDLGLGRAIQSECTQFARRTEMKIDYQQSAVPGSIAREISVVLFRVTQEALRNSQKHAGTDGVEVRLMGDGDRLRLMIRDRGAGFDPANIKFSRGIGLFSMKERVQLVQGDFSVDSVPGCGTTITVSVPLERRER